MAICNVCNFLCFIFDKSAPKAYYPLKFAIWTVIWVLLGQNVKIEQRSVASYQSPIKFYWNLVVNLCFQIGDESKSKIYLFLRVQIFTVVLTGDSVKPPI
jgi:hypothetical protein